MPWLTNFSSVSRGVKTRETGRNHRPWEKPARAIKCPGQRRGHPRCTRNAKRSQPKFTAQRGFIPALPPMRPARFFRFHCGLLLIDTYSSQNQSLRKKCMFVDNTSAPGQNWTINLIILPLLTNGHHWEKETNFLIFASFRR